LVVLEADKVEAQKQWDQDPCGANTVDDHAPGTLAYYQAIRQHRFHEYAPWFDAVVRFDDWRDRDVLEVGVGLGSDHYRFASNDNRMYALDLSREHLRQTSRHLALEGLGTRPVYGDAESIPFRDEAFDLVYSFGVLHHTPQTGAAVREIHRVLRRGGTAIIGLYHRDSYFMLATLLLRGVLKRELWTKSWRRMMSEIEHRADPDSAVPLVKVYSRAGARRLFEDFRRVDLTVTHIDVGRYFRWFPLGREAQERWLGWFGWYVIVRAEK